MRSVSEAAPLLDLRPFRDLTPRASALPLRRPRHLPALLRSGLQEDDCEKP